MLTLDIDRIIRRWPTARARKWLVAFLDRIRSDANVRALVAVGSAIRSGVPAEDLDLIAICLDRRRLRERAPIEVDLRSYDLDRVELGLRDGEDLLTWSVLFGQALFDREGEWHCIVDRWRNEIPLPDPTVARERAATARVQLDDMTRVGDKDAMVDLRVSYLTHLSRAALSEGGVYPASRPELPDQLRKLGQSALADELASALAARSEHRMANTAV